MDEAAHYVITKNWSSAKCSSEEAEVYYYVRHPNVVEIINRVVKA